MSVHKGPDKNNNTNNDTALRENIDDRRIFHVATILSTEMNPFTYDSFRGYCYYNEIAKGKKGIIFISFWSKML
jgi:hypothetical protein